MNNFKQLCIIGKQRTLKTTLIYYSCYFQLQESNLNAYIITSEEKFLTNTSLFGKLIPVYQETLMQMKVKLIKSYQEYIEVLASLSLIQEHQYDIFIFDDLQYFIGAEQKEKKLNLICFLISQIKPKYTNIIEYPIIICLQNDILGETINLVNLLRYHNFQIGELKISSKIQVQTISIIKIMENYQIQYQKQIMKELVQLINEKI